LPQLLRLLCICLGVTIMVAVQMHGVVNNQHRVQHSVQFPGVTYEAMAETAHDHDHHHDQAETGEDPDAGPVLDVVNNDDAPVSHHHHSGGDIHLALAAPVHPVGSGLMDALDLGPAPDALPPGLTGDDPTHPPRHARLIA
jgi:hypothetical protein